MLKRLIILIVLLILVFGGIFGWKYLQLQGMMAEMSKPRPPATVASAQVQRETWYPSLQAVGSLVAVQGVDVSSEVTGTVSEILFESGARVQQGAVLLKLDDKVDRATLVGLKADQRLAEIQFERASNLLTSKAVSKSNYDEAKAKQDAAQADVAEQQAIIDKKTIRAPFSGLLGIRHVDLGEYLQPGAKIVSLLMFDPIYVDYSLPEARFQEVEVGQKVVVHTPAYPDQSFEGRVSAIDAGITEGTRTIQIRATMKNPDGRLRPGMFTEVQTVQPDPQQVLTLPRTAISFNTYGDFVYIIRPDEKGDDQLVVKRQQVQTGDVREGRVQITKGLDADARVVRAGLVKLRDGQPVQIDNSVELEDAKVATP